MMAPPAIPNPPTYEDNEDSEDYDDEYDDSSYDDEYYDSTNSEEENENYELETPRDQWVKDPIQMGEPKPQSWDEFDASYDRPLTDMERTQKELDEAK